MTSNIIYNQISCIQCHKIFSTKSFHTHYQRIHDQSQSNYANQTVNAVAGAIKKAEERKQLYLLTPTTCIHCGKAHSYESRKSKFCSHSCAASYTNSRKDYSKIKPGPAKGTKPPGFLPYTKIKQCEVCGKFHPGSGKSCSKECKSKILSIATNKRMDNGWNPQEHRNKSKPSFLERSFADWLKTIDFSDYVKNKTFRCGQKIYYGDFYFPDKNLLIELDGKQHKDCIEYDSQRDIDILYHHNVTTLRISYDEFKAKTKIDLVLSLIK